MVTCLSTTVCHSGILFKVAAPGIKETIAFAAKYIFENLKDHEAMRDWFNSEIDARNKKHTLGYVEVWDDLGDVARILKASMYLDTICGSNSS